MAFPEGQPESASELMRAIDDQLSHIWMVRAFLKHSEEATDDQELASVHRDLYDFMLALGPSLEAGDAHRYLKLASKKFGRLRRAVELFHEIQPEVSGHTNFVMANHSLRIALRQIGLILNRLPETERNSSEKSLDTMEIEDEEVTE